MSVELLVEQFITLHSDVLLQASQPQLLEGKLPAVTIKAGNALGDILEDNTAQVTALLRVLACLQRIHPRDRLAEMLGAE